jgi:pyruvate-formate lyase-activating enzyme
MHPSIESRKGSLQNLHPLQWKTELVASLIVVTYCNQACPHCSVADMTRHSPPRDVPPAQVARDIHRMGPVGVIHLTGGEPTLHGDFASMLAAARSARSSLPLVLFTNGARLLAHADNIIRYCDSISMSVYDANSNAEEFTDLGVIEKFRALCPPYIRLMPTCVIHQKVLGGSNPCSRIFNTISVQEGHVYPCSAAHGIADTEYTDLSAGWEMRLLNIVAPCERCVFGEK